MSMDHKVIKNLCKNFRIVVFWCLIGWHVSNKQRPLIAESQWCILLYSSELTVAMRFWRILDIKHIFVLSRLYINPIRYVVVFAGLAGGSVEQIW